MPAPRTRDQRRGILSRRALRRNKGRLCCHGRDPRLHQCRGRFIGHRQTRRRALPVIPLEPLVLPRSNDLKRRGGFMLPRHEPLDGLLLRTRHTNVRIRECRQPLCGDGRMTGGATTHEKYYRGTTDTRQHVFQGKTETYIVVRTKRQGAVFYFLDDKGQLLWQTEFTIAESFSSAPG